MTFALWEKEGRVGVLGLEIVDVSKDGVTGLDGDFLVIFNDPQEETEETPVIEELIPLDLLFSLCFCSNGRSSKKSC